MVILKFHNQHFDDDITDLPIDDSLETRWTHDTHQNRTRTGLHEDVPSLQQDIGVVAVQTIQDTRATDTSGVPPYLKRKPLVRHDGMICSLLMGSAKRVDRQKATYMTSRTSCNCKVSEGTVTKLGDTISTVSDDGADCSDNDVDGDGDETQQEQEQEQELGVGVGPSRDGEFPPRVRRLRRLRKHLHLLMTQRMAAMSCVRCHWQCGEHDDGKITVVLAGPQIQDSPSLPLPPPRFGKRKRDDTERIMVASELHNTNTNTNGDDFDESTTRKRQRLGSYHNAGTSAVIQRVEDIGGLPANTDLGDACEVAAPPITMTGHLSGASALSVEPRRSQRIREKCRS